ncbi:MAG: dTDP-glucose 4,6-dehydratase [Acidimicrobiia bacterium]
MSKKVLVTGGAGFIGSNFVRLLLDSGVEVTNLDALTYAGVGATVQELDAYPNHQFVKGDIRDTTLLADVVPGHDAVVHFAAESHVDRSIEGPTAFLSTNVVGTGTVIDAARRASVPKFIHVSTDEVYGSIAEGFASEDGVLNPSSPYSASKAGSDLVALSYATTFDYPVIVTRCTNNYGPYQFPEKVIPLFVTNLIDGESVPLYGDGRNERDWLFVDDHCAAIELLLRVGTPGAVYNIGANEQLSNRDLTTTILALMGADESSVEFVADRPGHDLRYAVDSTKIRQLGWSPANDFSDGLERTIDWYRSRPDWWRPLKETP